MWLVGCLGTTGICFFLGAIVIGIGIWYGTTPAGQEVAQRRRDAATSTTAPAPPTTTPPVTAGRPDSPLETATSTSSTSPPPTEPPTTQPTTTSPPAPVTQPPPPAPTEPPPTTAAPAPPRITGFGAKRADWMATHTAIPGYTDVYTYPGGKYVAMSFGSNGTDGAYSYEIDLNEGTPIDNAKAMAMREFPADTRVLWYHEYPVCALMEVESPTLAAAFTDPKIGDPLGRAQVVLYNNPGGKVNPDGNLPLLRSKIDAITLALIDEPSAPAGDGNC